MPLTTNECLIYRQNFAEQFEMNRQHHIRRGARDITHEQHRTKRQRFVSRGPGDPRSMGTRIHEDLYRSLHRPYIGPDLPVLEDGEILEEAEARGSRAGEYY